MRTSVETSPVSVVLSGLTKSFGANEVLAGIDLTVEPGEILALLGPSGCGKTTVLRIIAGLEIPDSGTVSVGRRLVTGPSVHVATEHRNVGLIFQDGALFPHLTVGRNIGYGLRRAERKASPQIDAMLGLIGLEGFDDRIPDSLSGGQRQRVALGRALAPSPDVLLMDEPFSNLDAVLRTRLRSEVADVVRAAGVTSVFVTHDRDEAFAVADRVAIMRDGMIVQVADPRDLYRRPVDGWVAKFVGDANLVPCTVAVEGERVIATCELGSVAVSSDEVELETGETDSGEPAWGDLKRSILGDRVLVVRPEDLELVADSAIEGVQATLISQEFRGSTTLTTYRTPVATELLVELPGSTTATLASRLRLRTDAVLATVPPPSFC